MFRAGTMFGKLAVSKGSVVWFQKNKGLGHKENWEDFDGDMRKYPRIEKRR
jgi:hypothetical protein